MAAWPIYIDAEVASFGEFESTSGGGGVVVMSQDAAAAWPDRGSVGFKVVTANGSANHYGVPALSGTKGEYYCSVWINPRSNLSTASGDEWYVIRGMDGTTVQSMIQIRYDGSNFTFRAGLRMNAGWTRTVSYTIPQLDRWYHVAAYFKHDNGAGALSLYVDGVLQGSYTSQTADPDAVSEFRIGCSYKPTTASGDYYFDEVKIGDSYADVESYGDVSSSTAELSADQILVVYRSDDTDSRDWAEDYQSERGGPLRNLLAVPCSTTEVLADYATFQTEVETPISDWMALNTNAAANIACMILGPNVPGGFTYSGANYSATSRLSDIGQAFSGPVSNPFYNPSTISRLSRSTLNGYYLCSRIDAYDVSMAKSITDRAQVVESLSEISDDIILDTDHGVASYQTELRGFRDSVNRQLLRVDMQDVDYPFDPTIQDEAFFFGGDDVDSDAGFGGVGDGVFAYSGHDDCAATIRDDHNDIGGLIYSIGYAAAGGLVDDPGSDGYLSPKPFFDGLRLGLSVAEAFLIADPYISGQQVLVADPLMTAPIPKAGYNVYRGDYSSDDIDYTTIVAASADAGSVEVFDAGGGANKIVFYGVKSVCKHGVESEDAVVCRCRYDASGDEVGDEPNEVSNLTASASPGGKIELKWHHQTDEGFVTPTGFRIYHDGGTGTINTGVVIDTVAYHSRNHNYEWESGVLVDGTRYKFLVRAYYGSNEDGEWVTASAVADSTNPSPPSTVVIVTE